MESDNNKDIVAFHPELGARMENCTFSYSVNRLIRLIRLMIFLLGSAPDVYADILVHQLVVTLMDN